MAMKLLLSRIESLAVQVVFSFGDLEFLLAARCCAAEHAHSRQGLPGLDRNGGPGDPVGCLGRDLVLTRRTHFVLEKQHTRVTMRAFGHCHCGNAPRQRLRHHRRQH